MGEMISIYTDGACLGNPGPGGWAAVIDDGEDTKQISGHEEDTTNNRMEILAAIRGLEATSVQANVTIYSDSQYLVNTMTRGWERKANKDLWAMLDTAVESRQVKWEWVRGHSGNPGNEEADRLATGMAGSPAGAARLTHLDEQGSASMVDVGGKKETEREAVAKGSVSMRKATLELVKNGQVEKGEVLAVARVAGIMAAKRTSDLIPLCHPLPLDRVQVDMELDEKASKIHITATTRTTAKTGVEMEALTAVSVAALTIYDMCKAVDRGMKIDGIRLVRKRGGRSGDIVLEAM